MPPKKKKQKTNPPPPTCFTPPPADRVIFGKRRKRQAEWRAAEELARMAQGSRDNREQPNTNTSRGIALPVKKLPTSLTGEDRLRHAPRDTANPEHKHSGF